MKREMYTVYPDLGDKSMLIVCFTVYPFPVLPSKVTHLSKVTIAFKLVPAF